jgi:hypothetical protein
MRELTAVVGKVKKKKFSNTFSFQVSGNGLHYSLYYVVMSKTEGQTFRYRFGNETKTFWYRSRICLVENRLFWFGPESVRTKSPNDLFRWGRLENELRRFGFIPVRCRNVCGTFVPLLLPSLSMGQIGLRRFGFIPVRCRNVCGTFVPLLFWHY